MTRKSNRTSNSSKEITYKDIEKALKGRDLQNLSYKDMYELEQLGFGDWLKNNVKEISNFATTAFKDPASIPGMLESKYDQFTSSKEGDWLGRNWGNVAQTVGGGVLAGVGVLGSVFTGGASLAATGAGISMMSSGISGMSSDASEQRNIAAQNQATAEQNVLMQRQAQEQALLQRTAQDPIYGAVYADGGIIDDPEAYRDISITPSWKKKAREGVQYATDNALNQIHFVNVGNRSYRVGADELGDIRAFDRTRQGLRDYYYNALNPGLLARHDSLMPRGWNQEVFEEALKDDPSLQGTDLSYNEMFDAIGSTPEDRENFREYVNRFHNVSEAASESESGITDILGTAFASRNANLLHNLSIRSVDDPRYEGSMSAQSLPGIPSVRAGRSGSDLRIFSKNTSNIIPGAAIKRVLTDNDSEIALGILLREGGEDVIRRSAEESGYTPREVEKFIQGISARLEDLFSEAQSPEEYYKIYDELTGVSEDYINRFTGDKKKAYKLSEELGFFAHGGYTGLPTYATGGTINYEGQLHDGPDGGIPVDEMGNPSVNPVALTEGKEVAYSSDEGTYIFSDRLKYSDSKTFAQRAKDLQKKYELRAKTKGGTFQLDDPISKKGYDMEMQKLIGQQEQLKEMTMPQQQPQPQEMGYEEMPMFPFGGGINTTGAEQYQGMHWGQAALSALPDVAAGITNLIRGGNRRRNRRRNNPYSKLNAPYMVAEQINLENERAAAREQANVARANTSRGLRAGAPTAGSYMANMIAGETGIQRGLGQQLGDSYQREAVANAQMRQQAAMANQQAEMQARGYNAQMEAQNRAQADAMTGAGISQIGQGITGAYNQYAADRRHVQSLNMMSPDYALYHDEGSKWYNPKYSRRMTPEGKANQAERLAHHKAEMEKYRSLGATTIEKQLEMLLKDYPDTSKEEIIRLLNQ